MILEITATIRMEFPSTLRASERAMNQVHYGEALEAELDRLFPNANFFIKSEWLSKPKS